MELMQIVFTFVTLAVLPLVPVFALAETDLPLNKFQVSLHVVMAMSLMILFWFIFMPVFIEAARGGYLLG